MGSPDMGKKINIFHIVEFILAIIVAVCLADNECIHCGKHIIQIQFITTSAFAFLIIMSVIFIGMFIDEEIGTKSDAIYDAVGAIMCIVSGALIIIYVEDYGDYMRDRSYYRLVLGAGCFFANGGLFLIEFFLLLFKKEALGAGD